MDTGNTALCLKFDLKKVISAADITNMIGVAAQQLDTTDFNQLIVDLKEVINTNCLLQA